MQIAILSSDSQKAEWEAMRSNGNEVRWVNTWQELCAEKADVYIDLLFEADECRIAGLAKLLPSLVMINAVTVTLREIGEPFARVNGWPGFLKRDLLEVAVVREEQAAQVEELASALNCSCRLVADEPGMVAARVIAMIVNEAYYAWQEGVSTKAEIDLAMKTGTNYPFGPFEWANRIGLIEIYKLLHSLSGTDERYRIATSLAAEAVPAR